MTEQKNTKPKVAVVGSINMDMVSHSRRLPAPGETLMGESFVAAPGGKGANQAVAASRLGAAVSFVSRVGTREHGETLLSALASEGVAFGGSRDPQALPGIAVIMVASVGGENAIVVIPGSNADLRASDVDAAAAELQSANVVVAQLEVPQPPILRAFEIARAAGRTTVLNAAPALTLVDGLLALTDWLVLNETEAEQLSGLTDVEAAAQTLLARGCKAVLITLGADGALLCNAAGLERFGARKVNAVDTVGAGDTFVGGLATGLAEGRSAGDAIRLGQAAAAIAVSRSGVQSAMPQRAELGAEFV